MAIRKDERVEINLPTNNLNTRDDFRQFLLAKWAKESVAQKYRYFVEKLSDGGRVYLERPGRLNKGCDFVIFIEDLFLYKNGNNRPPSHKDLCIDLHNKKTHLSKTNWKHLIASIEAVHTMASYTVPPECEEAINRLPLMSLEQIQLLCKWLFIEQDLTYWSGKGRDMLWDKIGSI